MSKEEEKCSTTVEEFEEKLKKYGEDPAEFIEGLIESLRDQDIRGDMVKSFLCMPEELQLKFFKKFNDKLFHVKATYTVTLDRIVEATTQEEAQKIADKKVVNWLHSFTRAGLPIDNLENWVIDTGPLMKKLKEFKYKIE